MMLRNSHLAASCALMAALSGAAAPAAAADMPRVAQIAPLRTWDPHSGDVAHRRRHHHDNGIDGGDVLAGLLIIGGIAAIASAADSADRDRDRAYPPRPQRDYPGGAPYRQPNRVQMSQSRGLDNAMNICVGEIERRGDRVSSVESAARTPEGWNVAGIMQGGDSFSCWIGEDGRISDISIDRPWRGAEAPPSLLDIPNNQWSDEYYARARARVRGESAEPSYDDQPRDGEAVNVDGDLGV